MFKNTIKALHQTVTSINGKIIAKETLIDLKSTKHKKPTEKNKAVLTKGSDFFITSLRDAETPTIPNAILNFTWSFFSVEEN